MACLPLKLRRCSGEYLAGSLDARQARRLFLKDRVPSQLALSDSRYRDFVPQYAMSLFRPLNAVPALVGATLLNPFP